MNLIFFREGITASLVSILTLIEHKPELIVGCVLCGEDADGNVPCWFIDSTLADNPSAEILDHAKNGMVLRNLSVFLIVKEPNSLLQLTVLAAVNCCNLNFSGEGGRGGRKVIQLLAKHNIRVYPAEVKCSDRDFDKTYIERQEELRVAFESGFNVVAERWLPQSWGLAPVRY